MHVLQQAKVMPLSGAFAVHETNTIVPRTDSDRSSEGTCATYAHKVQIKVPRTTATADYHEWQLCNSEGTHAAQTKPLLLVTAVDDTAAPAEVIIDSSHNVLVCPVKTKTKICQALVNTSASADSDDNLLNADDKCGGKLK